jgi:hypothetical protein
VIPEAFQAGVFCSHQNGLSCKAVNFVHLQNVGFLLASYIVFWGSESGWCKVFDVVVGGVVINFLNGAVPMFYYFDTDIFRNCESIYYPGDRKDMA